MAYTKYSLTPANNTATPPDGAPEGMLPSAVNDTMRDMMAQIRDCGDGIRDGTYTMTAAKITGGTITGVTFTGNTFSNPTVTGVSTFAAGTVSAPAITTSGDTNTGIYFPAADTIAFTEGGVESMRIDSSGNLGIGITNPAEKLDVYGAINLRSGYNLQWGSSANYIAATSSVMLFQLNSSERMRIDSSGNVSVGTSTALGTAAGRGNITINGSSTSILVLGTGGSLKGYVYHNGTDMSVQNDVNGYLNLVTNGLERMRIASDGSVGIGTTAPIKPLSVEITSARSATTDNEAIRVSFGTTSGTQQSVSIGFATGVSNTYPAAKIELLEFDAVDSRGSLLFYTRNDNADSAPTERMRITSGGALLVGKTTDALSTAGSYIQPTGEVGITTDGSVTNPLYINRLTNDGVLVEFRQANTKEGDISVSGTTVSYNGGHLARYAQTTAPKDNTLLKGTVLSNLDEMNEYVRPTTYWTEDDELPEGVNVGDVKEESAVVDNEQLNKVKVSDVEGDVNVAGVFVNWSHDEQHNVDEINMAMTGDMIIRIAQGVVVQKGDLLMSAGDGTAKPQGDDIVRSKTIAKVTSNHVTCTYADGSYCVPCVLMAC
jgi:hypothetical protein